MRTQIVYEICLLVLSTTTVITSGSKPTTDDNITLMY